MTDYRSELQRLTFLIGDTVAAAQDGSCSASGQRASLLYLRFHLLSLTGDLDRLGSLVPDIDEAIHATALPQDLLLLKAHVAVQLHRFAEAEMLLLSDESLRSSAETRLVQADVDMQRARYTDALRKIQLAIEEEPTWGAFARLAYLSVLAGDRQSADGLYLKAQDELTAKQMRAYAWLEIQRGILDFQYGCLAAAREHYERANAAYSGYWIVEERVAELLGAQGQFEAAIARYEQLYADAPKPQWEHALGNLYYLAGQHDLAHEWKVQALRHCLGSTDRGDLHYIHLLVDLCCDMVGYESVALEWAQKDEHLRSNFMTRGDLAWAWYRCGNIESASMWIGKALQAKAVSTRLLQQAACIYHSAGDVEASARYMRLARQLNPTPAKARMPAVKPRVKSQLHAAAQSGLGSPKIAHRIL